MTAYPERVSQCIQWVRSRLQDRVAPATGLADANDSVLGVILKRAGYKRLTANSIRALSDAFRMEGIYTYPPLDEPGIDRKTRIYFSDTPVPFEGLAQPQALFNTERMLQEFIVKNFATLSVLKPLSFRAQDFRLLPGGDRIDILATDDKTRELVIIELKWGVPDRGVVDQLLSYARSLSALVAKENRPGVRAILISGQPDRGLADSLQAAGRGGGLKISWYLYQVAIDLKTAPGM